MNAGSRESNLQPVSERVRRGDAQAGPPSPGALKEAPNALYNPSLNDGHPTAIANDDEQEGHHDHKHMGDGVNGPKSQDMLWRRNNPGPTSSGATGTPVRTPRPASLASAHDPDQVHENGDAHPPSSTETSTHHHEQQQQQKRHGGSTALHKLKTGGAEYRQSKRTHEKLTTGTSGDDDATFSRDIYAHGAGAHHGGQAPPPPATQGPTTPGGGATWGDGGGVPEFRGPFFDADVSVERTLAKLERDPLQKKRDALARQRLQHDDTEGEGEAVTSPRHDDGHGEGGTEREGADESEWIDEERDHVDSRTTTTAGANNRARGRVGFGAASSQKSKSRQSSIDRGYESDRGPGGGAPRPGMGKHRGSGWNALRAKLGGGAQGPGALHKGVKDLSRTLSGHELTTELTMGLLPMVLVKMGTIDRDEHGQKRIPVLMNYLSTPSPFSPLMSAWLTRRGRRTELRITDSIYPFHDRHASFRIELQYGDGLVKWVIYRELRDFLNLHAHYRVAQFGAGVDKVPAFPKTSLPYFNWLKSEGRSQVGRAEFARLQREALETYLLKLIRANVRVPRLCPLTGDQD